MAVEVGLAGMILMAAGNLLPRFQETRETDPGFRREGVLLTAYDMSGGATDTGAHVRPAARQAPGASGSGCRRHRGSVPLDIHGLPVRSFSLEGRARAEPPGRGPLQRRHPGVLRRHGRAPGRGPGFRGARRPAAAPRRSSTRRSWDRYLDGGEPLGRRLKREAGATPSSAWCGPQSRTRSASRLRQ